MRQFFHFRRIADSRTMLALLLVAVISLTIRQSGSATIIQNNATKESAASVGKDSGKTDERGARGVETFVEDNREAVVLLYEYNPWAMVIGSDSPSFALYDNGLLIFTRINNEGRPEYASLTLGKQELIDFLASLPVKEFNELRPDYELDLRTDQPTNVLSVRNSTGLKSVRVYGKLERSTKADDPAAFIEIYRKLKSFQDSRAARWMPEKVELMLWPYENAGSPLSWPKDWPDINHPTTKKKGVGRESINYSIYLTPAQYRRLRQQVESASADALLVNKRKWAFSFRFPFPNEDSWRKKASEETT